MSSTNATALAFATRCAELAEWAQDRLVNRTDVWGGYLPMHRRKPGASPNVTKPAKNHRGRKTLTKELIKAHFVGADPGSIIGLHAIAADNTCRWFAIEVDAHGEARPNNWPAARKIIERLESLGLHVLVTDSNGKGGFHLLVIFDLPLPSDMVFRFAQSLVGDWRELSLSECPETFPKQASLTKEVPYGNWLRLAGRHHTREHWSRVWGGDAWYDGDDAVDLILKAPVSSSTIITQYAPAPAPPKAPPPNTQTRTANGDDNRVIRAEAYIHEMPGAISGQRGHDATFNVACECFRFGLSESEAWSQLRDYNRRCQPEWSEKDLRHKLDSARQTVEGAGEFGSRLREDRPGKNGEAKMPKHATSGVTSQAPEDRVLDRKDPLNMARRFVADRHHHPEHPSLIRADDEFHRFEANHWKIIKKEAIRKQVYEFLEPFNVVAGKSANPSLEPFKPTDRNVDAVVDALKAVTYRPVQSPQWITGDGMPDPSQLIVATNGIFRLTGDDAVKVSDPTPRMFNTSALDYAFDPNAPLPRQWMGFLDDVFDGDQQQIALAQEWGGLILTSDTRYQKMLLMIGPPRCGKGTIARVYARMVGLDNCCAPTLAGLGSQFGLSPLIGKTLATISDARLSQRSDQAIVTERLLSITGEDAVTIDRKNREHLTTTLRTRIMILTNEVPRLTDASGALANRQVILVFRKSYLGCEDVGLTDRLIPEVQGIAAWALQGLYRLRREQRFTQPAAGDDLRNEMNDLASPVHAFVREWCTVRPGLQVERSELFDAWCAWCRQQGNEKHGTQAVFGRDLRAAVPRIGSSQPTTDDGDRTRVYRGIELKLVGQEAAAKWRSEQDRTCSQAAHA